MNKFIVALGLPLCLMPVASLAGDCVGGLSTSSAYDFTLKAKYIPTRGPIPGVQVVITAPGYSSFSLSGQTDSNGEEKFKLPMETCDGSQNNIRYTVAATHNKEAKFAEIQRSNYPGEAFVLIYWIMKPPE